MADPNQASVGDKRMHLGWLVGSSVQPAKRREIEGVSNVSIMDLQAQLYVAQEARQAEGTGQGQNRPRRGGLEVKGQGGLGKANSGVEARNQRDLEHVKRRVKQNEHNLIAIASAPNHRGISQNWEERERPVSTMYICMQSSSQQVSESYAALERKAALYDKLARGEVDDNDDRYEVDFLSKQEWRHHRKGSHDRSDHDIHDERPNTDQPGPRGVSYPAPASGRGFGPNMEGLDEEQAAARRQQHKEVVLQLAQQTHEQRQKAEELKRHKEDQATAKVEKLKEGFLKKQAAKLLQSKLAKSKSQ